ncbi:VOC family protein [Salinimicrobium tongyeongense]|uniref:VOC family protein n=1 Tax=Salinimicrobium tongyeongense TaxID=2809707 RepID=A0ABY6NQZ3_9FLAO|nr:VOC family protein [Salinimicrobium tongyeongense]UZH55238.1 VOC family protein [Salinimicrobium tongyeongense]
MKKREQKIIPNLWFDTEAGEAVKFYTSLFKDSKIHSQTQYSEAGQEIHQKEPGSVMTVAFELEGYQLLALNGGPPFKFNPSISLFVVCDNEEEINRLWNALFEGGEVLLPLDSYDWSERYGWLQDRYGLNWQLMLKDREYHPEQKICPLLFFTGARHKKAEEAVKFYTSVFENSAIEGIQKYEKDDNNNYALGGVKHAQFQLFEETFMAMDSGMENDFPFNEAISFIIQCKDQQEIDRYWELLTKGGDPQAQQCGWLKDKFGISWQVVPYGMEKLLNDPDRQKVKRAMEAMMKMKKIEVHQLTMNN